MAAPAPSEDAGRRGARSAGRWRHEQHQLQQHRPPARGPHPRRHPRRFEHPRGGPGRRQPPAQRRRGRLGSGARRHVPHPRRPRRHLRIHGLRFRRRGHHGRQRLALRRPWTAPPATATRRGTPTSGRLLGPPSRACTPPSSPVPAAVSRTSSSSGPVCTTAATCTPGDPRPPARSTRAGSARADPALGVLPVAVGSARRDSVSAPGTSPRPTAGPTPTPGQRTRRVAPRAHRDHPRGNDIDDHRAGPAQSHHRTGRAACAGQVPAGRGASRTWPALHDGGHPEGGEAQQGAHHGEGAVVRHGTQVGGDVMGPVGRPGCARWWWAGSGGAVDMLSGSGSAPRGTSSEALDQPVGLPYPGPAPTQRPVVLGQGRQSLGLGDSRDVVPAQPPQPRRTSWPTPHAPRRSPTASRR